MRSKKSTTGNKRNFRDYHSSDYGNEEEEDYGQDYNDENDDFDNHKDSKQSLRPNRGALDSGDSDFSGEEGAFKSSKRKTKRPTSNQEDQQESNEDTFEEEDPFSPEVDLILADKVVEEPITTGQASTNNQMGKHGFSTRQQQHVLAPKTHKEYLVKFMDQSYIHVRWMSEKELEDYSYKAKQKIRRYSQQKEKKRFISEQLSRQAINFLKTGDQDMNQGQQPGLRGKGGLNHHFSDDEEEDEDANEALIDVAELNIPPLEDPMAVDNPLGTNAAQLEPPKPNFIAVKGSNGEDLLQYFDKNYAAVERVVSTTIIFPVIHPRQAKQVRGKWQEDCLNVVNVLINYRKNNVSIGLAFAEQLDPENESLANYFKVIKQPIDLTIITNRLYNRSYQQPQDFWNDLGLVFKNCRLYHQSKKVALRKQCEVLRCLAYNLYRDWHSEQKTRFQTGNVAPQNKQQSSVTPTEQSLSLKLTQNNTASFQNAEEIQAPSTQQQSSFPIKINLQSLLINKKQNQDLRLPENQANSINQQDMNKQVFNASQQQFQAPQNLPKFNNVVQNISNQQISMQGSSAFNTQSQMMQQTNQNILNPNQIQQIDWMQGGTNQSLGIQMQNPLFSQNHMLPSLQQAMDFNTNRQIQLPSIGQLNPNIMMQNQGLLGYPASLMNINGMSLLPSLSQFSTPYGHQLMSLHSQQQPFIDMNIIQAINNLPGLTFQDKNNLINQIVTGQLPTSIISQLLPSYNIPIQNQYEAMALMGQGGGPQDYSSMIQLGMRGLQPHTQQLPSINQIQGLNQMIGSQGQQFQLPSISQPPSSKDPFKQQVQQTLAQGNQPNLPKLSTMNTMQQSMSSVTEEHSLQGSVNMQGVKPTSQLNSFQNSTQASSMSSRQPNPNDLRMNKNPRGTAEDQLDTNAHQSEKQEAFVQPAIIDPGKFDLAWILAPGDSVDELEKCPYLTEDEIKLAIQNKRNVDQLYLVKWKGLSYSQCTWEPESVFKAIFDEKIQDYNRYNRSLDQYQRDRLDQLIRNHKKMLRFTEKKTQGHGHKKVDSAIEEVQSLQEAKINRQLLNQKIQDIMGEMYFQVVQYNVANGQVPVFKKPHQQLKKYQVAGLNWLIRAWHEHRNVVLADEMGLGKTIMTLSLFDHLNKVCKLRGPFLILAPLTTLEHWKRIADEWTHMNSILYYDPNSAEGREQIRNWEWFYTDVTYKGTVTQKSELFKFNIMITSFEVFMSDLNPIIQQIPFAYIVVDEAHRLKNKQAKTLKLLKDHPCKRILLLTGTPVQNNTKELWTLLNYIEPEKFNNMDLFLEQYGNLESFDQIQKLHTILKPHFLRRLKEEVEDSIPPLNETVVEVGLTNLQNTYYKGIYGENRMVLAKFGTNSIKTSQLNNMDVQLRKCCNHLFLLKGVEEELTRDCKSDEDLYNKLLESSGKLMLLDKFIEKFKKENHKMLIFSQFKRMLDIIELYLKMKGVSYEKLTGSVKNQDRVSAIQRFNNDGNQNPNKENNFGVFLLTTRAGGLGINLTSARVVIIFDSDWNPQNDLQAIARAHRIGQKFEVQVYRLITSKTYEEQMFERASKKLGMEQALFSKGAFNQNTSDENIAMEGGLQLRALTDLKQDSKEIENLLKYGAYAFLDNNEGGQNGEDIINLKNKDIDEILATGKKKEFQYNKGVYTLQKSTFNASKYERGGNMIDINDPEFWNKVLPYDQLMSISVIEKRFKKDKKEICKNESDQTDFIKDLEIVFNDFMDAKFDNRITAASKKQIESDEETLRELLKKLVKLSGMRPQYVERCKEWLREMLRTSKRKKPVQITAPEEKSGNAQIPDDDEDGAGVEEDDIIMYDSDNEGKRPLRKRPVNVGDNNNDNSNSQSGNIIEGKKKNFDSYEDEKDGYSNDLGNGFMRRSQRQRKPARNDFANTHVAGDAFDDNDEAFTLKKTGQKRRVGRPSLEDADDLSGEERYGLRGRKKRQKIDDHRENMNLNKTAQSSSNILENQNEIGASGKNSHMIMKRNEKNGIVCAVCWQPETAENPCVWFCHKYCQRSFHHSCKEKVFPEQPDSKKMQPNGFWECEDCTENTAECFCCKKKGIILVFPKKGKPKAAGSANYQNEISPFGAENGNNIEEDEIQEDLNEEEKQIDNDKMQVDNKEDNIDQQKQLVDQELQDSSPVKLNQESLIIQQQDDQKRVDSQEYIIKLKEDSSPKKIGEIYEDQQNCTHKDNEEEEKDKIEQLSLDKEAQDVQMTEMQSIQMNNADEPDPNDSKYVVRCTLGGCFKYYHVVCVYRNKNVSCINSMKVQRFRCPLHYCEICQASGDSVLIVQCVACPTAYHVKCIPKGDPNAIKLTKKYVVCKRHNVSASDFPRFEERMGPVHQTPMQPRINPSSTVVNTAIFGVISEAQADASGKPPPKKRGRKPKSYYAELEAKAAAQKLAADQAFILGKQNDQIELNDPASQGFASIKITEPQPLEEDEEEEEIKMPWNNKPPSGGEDLECADEFPEDQQDMASPSQSYQLVNQARIADNQYIQVGEQMQTPIKLQDEPATNQNNAAAVIKILNDGQRTSFGIHSATGFEEPIERPLTPEEIQMVLHLQLQRNQHLQIKQEPNSNNQ